MQQADLNRAVAHATGESITTIKRLGFLLAEEEESFDFEDEDLGPYVIDWDALEQQQLAEANGHHLVPA